jgi:ribosomal protein S18 acetylase RimI-like enzyme
MPFALAPAGPPDAVTVAALQNAASRRLTERYGKGSWSSKVTERGVQFAMSRSTVYLARSGDRPVATLTLSTRKPWAIDLRYFTAVNRPLYLTAMAADPDAQGRGFGRLCLAESRRIATAWPADAIRLDAWDAEGGAAGFYQKCGFREVGRAVYRSAPLIYLEWLP